MSDSSISKRIVSLDQFRGYTVAGMFVVNFLGGLAVIHPLFKHNNTHFSYADSIMPSFLFACGFSYRLSFLKRLAERGAASARRSFLSRSLGLILLSMMLTAFNSKFESGSAMTYEKVVRFLGELLKANLWEVLAIIGACQILLLPLIATRARTRFLALGSFALLHILLSWSFNHDFVYGRPNWMDSLWGTTGKRAWDGGFFGLLSWAEIMLAGSLVFDLLMRHDAKRSSSTLVAIGSLLMLGGYGLSCMTTLYNIDPQSAQAPSSIAPSSIAPTSLDDSPVVPSWARATNRSWKSLMAEPPFVAPPPPDQRRINYWMMDKRMVSQSFVFFSTGFAMTVYGLFVLWCDLFQGSWGLFRTFGQNPLAAYIIHHFVQVSILALVPKDSTLLGSLVGLSIFFGITYYFVRFLEQRKLYLRL